MSVVLILVLMNIVLVIVVFSGCRVFDNDGGFIVVLMILVMMIYGKRSTKTLAVIPVTIFHIVSFYVLFKLSKPFS